MFKLNYFTLQQLVEKNINVHLYICGDKFKLFIGEGNMLYYKHKYDTVIYRLKLSDEYEICLD